MNPSNHEASDGPTVAPQIVVGSPAPNSSAVQPSRAELEAYITSTRLELQALSETLNVCVDPVTYPTQTAAPQHDSLAESVTEDAGPDPLPVDRRSPDTPMLTVECQRTDRDISVDDNTDPMARLNAIKLRLAQQIENAS